MTESHLLYHALAILHTKFCKPISQNRGESGSAPCRSAPGLAQLVYVPQLIWYVLGLGFSRQRQLGITPRTPAVYCYN